MTVRNTTIINYLDSIDCIVSEILSEDGCIVTPYRKFETHKFSYYYACSFAIATSCICGNVFWDVVSYVKLAGIWFLVGISV